MDTQSDYRILFIERMVERISSWAKSGAVKDKEGITNALSSLVKEMKYSYLDGETLVNTYFPRLKDLAEKLLALPWKEDKKRYVEYFAREVDDLPNKFSRPCTEPFMVFRYAIVDVKSVSKLTDTLFVTRVSDGKNEYTVVTNIPDVKTGTRAAVVFLPPREFNGVVSEAMFVKMNVNGPEDITPEDLRGINKYFNEV